MAKEDDELPDRILRIAEVVKLTGMSEATIRREIDAGRFPPPLMISARCRGWLLSTVLAWLATRPTSTLL